MIFSTSTSSKYPSLSAYIIATCCPTGRGTFCACFSTSTLLCPLANCLFVAASKSSVPNWAKVTNSLYWAKSSRICPATDFIDLLWAALPTRETDNPTFTAGLVPALNNSGSRYICPSVIEITFVGTYAETSPA